MLEKLWEEILNNKDKFTLRYTQKLSEIVTEYSYYIKETNNEILDVIIVKGKPIGIKVRKEKGLFCGARIESEGKK